MSSIHDSEVFQSSWTSWSSKIIALGIVECSQRIAGCIQASRYSQVYSSKSAASPTGSASGARRERTNSSVCGETSSAYTWSPISSSSRGHASRVLVA